MQLARLIAGSKKIPKGYAHWHIGFLGNLYDIVICFFARLTGVTNYKATARQGRNSSGAVAMKHMGKLNAAKV
jgi:hypothetical protein